MNPHKYAYLKGWDLYIKSLNREILKITNGSRDGLIRSAKYIRRDMKTTEPFIPFDVGNLEASWEIHNIHEGNVAGSRKAAQYGIMFGFSANYAIHVHEMVDAVNWTRKGSGPHFFSEAIDRNQDVILQIIASSSKVKP